MVELPVGQEEEGGRREEWIGRREVEGGKEKEGGGRQFLARGSQAIVIQDELKLKGLHHRDSAASFIILSRDRVCNAGPESGPAGKIDGTKTLPHPI